MRFLPPGIIRFVSLAAFSSALAALLLSLHSTQAVNAATSGLAYDEVMKFVAGDQPTPTPGNFRGDYQAAVDAAKQANSAFAHHGFLSVITHAGQIANAAVGMYKSGMASGHYYMNNWQRTDDPGKQTATIVRPDRKQIIHLDLAKKTYRIEEMATQNYNETPPPYNGPPEQQPSPQPGTGKLDISETTTVLGPKTIDGMATTGYSQDLKMTTTQSTGSCKDGTFEASMVEYASNIAPPLQKMNQALKFHMNLTPQAMLSGQHPGCNPTTTTHHSGKATLPSDKLLLWTLMTFKGSTETNSAKAGGGFSTLTERGNVRELGASDASLFDVPADFTKES